IVTFAILSRHATPVAVVSSTVHTTAGSGGIALIGVLWAYHGWHNLGYVAGEGRNPSQVLPRGFFSAVMILIAVYLSANLAYLRVLPLSVMAQDGYQRVAAKTMEILWGPIGAAFVSGLILCSIFGAINGNILCGARVYYAMSHDRLLFASVGRIHPR